MKLMRKTTLLVLLSLSMIFGCGGPQNRAEVRGTVRVNGQPLDHGSITFRPTDGNDGPTAGGEIVKGAYCVDRAKGVAIGKNQVAIQCTVRTGRQITGGRGMTQEQKIEVIPPRYNRASELACDVKPGANQLDFELQVTSADGVPEGIFGTKK
jgi:hypothetical protein